MPMMLLTLGSVIAFAGATFFFLRWLHMRSGYQAMSVVERRYAEITDRTETLERKEHGFAARLQADLLAATGGNGYSLLVALASIAYLVFVVVLSVIGLPTVYALGVAIPLVVISGRVTSVALAGRRRRAFKQQMIELLDGLAGQVKTTGPARALEIVVPTMPNPLRGEMTKVIDSYRSGADLLEGLRELSERYPSRAFDVFLAALEIDQREGKAIGSALRQASTMLKRDFALQSEAESEIAGARWEFLGVAGMILLIAAVMIFKSSPENKAAYLKPIGLGVLAVAAGWYSVGVYRFWRLLERIGGSN